LENATRHVVYTRNRDVTDVTGAREKICTCESIKPIMDGGVRHLTTSVMAVHALTVADDLDLDSSRTRPGLDQNTTRTRPGLDQDTTRTRPGLDPDTTRASPGHHQDSTRTRPGLDPDLNRPASPSRALVVVSETFALSELGLALRRWFVRGTEQQRQTAIPSAAK